MTTLKNRTSTLLLCATIIVTPLPGNGSDQVTNPSPEWIAGHWCADTGGGTVEELWLPPYGGVMVGLARTRNAERTTGFEYLRIVPLDGVLNYIAQPGGSPPTNFQRTAGGENWVRFENPEHDFPQRIEYRREGDVLHAEVAGPGEESEETVIGFDYRLCSPPAGAGNLAR